MSTKWIKKTVAAIPDLLGYTLVGLLVLAVSILFPSDIHFDYEFKQGARWEYEDLKAPFSFPILKSEQELEHERKQLEENFISYYNYDKTILEKQKENFISLHARGILAEAQKDSVSIDSVVSLNLGLSIIDTIYNRYLIELSIDDQSKGDAFTFELLEGNIAKGEYVLSEVWTTKEAMQYIVDALDKGDLPHRESLMLLNLLEQVLEEPNIYFDEAFTQATKKEALANVSPFRGMVNAGDFVVLEGGFVDSITHAKLLSYEEKYDQEINNHKNGFLIYLGYLCLTVALLSIFAIFVQFYNPKVFGNARHFALILTLIAAYAYFAYIVDGQHLVSKYLIPFCIAPIIVRNFFSSQLALFTHIVIILLTSMLLSLDYQFILVQIIVGMVVIISKLKLRYLSDFFISLLYIALAYTACFVSLELIHTGAISPVMADNGTEIEEGVRWSMLIWIAGNVFLTMLSFPLLPLIGRIFGLTSDISLVEMSDLNNPLLKELSLKAPGTLQHSLQVANLAEAAVTEVGGNGLLVKVAALYHDIGKMADPEYYIENQNQYNPHEKLDYLQSARKIIDHITEGVKIAKNYRLPQVIVDFILSHHGTTRVEYFYRMYQKDNPDKEVDEQLFRYPGPKPQNKEQAILMIADSIEAASKSLKNPTGIDIDNLVENIIKGKIGQGQLNETNLSFSDLEKVKRVLKKLLRSIYHVRIEYPEEQKKKA